ncbi:SagB family peptide dehydrogenase [Streptomyces avermitilis]|uniref:SagB family peptide dehydrogenase n=1 Tax=Streptomyces avermitilis TaxID=33903 RepID=UPI00339F6FE4
MTTYATSAGAAALRFLQSGHRPPDALPAADSAQLPPVYKRYPLAEAHVLPDARDPRAEDPSLRLSWLLRQTNGLTRMRWMSGIMPLGLAGPGPGAPGQGVLLAPGRPGASSGARYPVEVYLAHGGTDALAAGLFHYDPAHHALERLRPGDGRGRIMSTLSGPSAPPPESVLLLSSVLWRNAAKYGAFGYRLQSLDTGVLAAQAAAAAEATGLAASVRLRYDDEALDALLGLSPFAESVFAVISLHRTGGRAQAASDGPADWTGPVPESVPEPLSIAELPPLAEAAALHAAIRAGRPGGRPGAGTAPPDWTPPPGAARQELPGHALDLAEGFGRRRTVHGFWPGPVPLRTLAAVLATAGAPLATDAPGAVRLAGVLQRIEDVPTGAYVHDLDGHALIRTRQADAVGALIAAAKSPMLADEGRTATATLVPCADLRAGIESFGDRSYRTQNIEAGMVAQRIALAAAAAGLESHVHCDFDPDGVQSALGLGTGRLQPLVVVTVGPLAPDRTDPQLPL